MEAGSQDKPGPSSAVSLQDTSSEESSSDSDYNDEAIGRDVLSPGEMAQEYEDELETDLNVQKKKKKRNISKLPIHLKGLMGEANLRFVRSDRETAEKMCYEVIRQEPYAFEPYLTLSQMYETSDPEKSMQYLSIAVHLNPSDCDNWLRLAQLYVDKNKIKSAVTCITRATQSDPRNIDLHLKRIELLETLNDNKNVLKCKVRLLQVYSKKDHTSIIKLAMELAEHFYTEKDYAKAMEAMNVPFTKCNKYVTPEMVNIYLELLLLTNNHAQCLDIFVQFCSIEIEIMIDDDSKIQVISYNIPEIVQIDLRIKFIICLIKLHAFHLIDKMLEPLLMDETNVEKIGDLYLDVAEAYMGVSKHTEALKLLIPLIKSNNFSLAAVWLKHAECLNACEMHEQAIDSYFNVVKLAPQHIEVRYPLSDLLLKANRFDEAVEVLNQSSDSDLIDVELLIKRMNLLRSLNRLEEYFDSVELLLSRHCIILNHPSELRQVTFQETVREKLYRINKLREFRGVELHPVEPVKSIREPSIEEEFELYKEILNFCYKNEHYVQLKRFAFYGLSSSRLKLYYNEISVYALYACIFCKDNIAHVIIRELILRKNNKHNHLIWNIYNLTMQHQIEYRSTRFVRCRNIEILKIIEANNALSSTSYKIATIQLISLLKTQPTPFIYLLLGVCFLQVCCQKHRDIKRKLTQCSYGLFLNYANKRGQMAYQEVYYNLGRMYHQFGVLHIAAHYYKLVLNSKPSEEHGEVLNLHREAAFNLMLIYKDSENFMGARNLMIKYLTI